MLYEKALAIAMLLMSASSLIGCSDDEIIGTGIQGLKLPARINVIPPKDENTNPSIAKLGISAQAVFSDAGTDYSNDTSNSYTVNELQSALDEPNDILCFLDSLKLDLMVNKGPYTAILTKDPCSTKNETNTTKPSLYSITAISERKDNQSPQKIKAWISYTINDESYRDAVIPATTIIEGNIMANVSENQPYGAFSISDSYSLDSVIYGGTAGEEVTTLQGTFLTDTSIKNEPQFKSIFAFDVSSPTKVKGSNSSNITLNPKDHQSGKVLYKENFTSSDILFNEIFGGEFNSTNILQGKDSNQDNIFESPTCHSRDQIADLYVDNYRLYHAFDSTFRGSAVSAGERLNLYTGQYFSYEGSLGFISYTGGFWLSGSSGLFDDTIPDGATVTKYLDTDTYSYHVSPGRLTIHSSSKLVLSKLENTILTYYGLHPNPQIASYAKWLVRVAANEFTIEGMLEPTSTRNDYPTTIDHDKNTDTPEVSVVFTLSLTDVEKITFTDLSYGASYNYQHDISIPPTERMISKGINDSYLVPSDPLISSGPVTLYCYTQCPKGGLNQAMVDSASIVDDLYYSYGAFSATPYSYKLSSDNHKTVLTDSSNGKIVDVTGLTTTTYPLSLYVSYYESGRLLAQPLIEPATLSQLFDTKDYYSWVAGNTTRNHMSTLVDSSGKDVIFDRSLSITYQHDAAHDLNNTNPDTNPYHGKFYTFSGEAFSSELDAFGEYRRPFSVRNGTQLSNEEGDFVVKATQIEQSRQLVDINLCSTLGINNLLSDPSMSLLTAEDIIPVSFGLSDKPIINGPPAIIDGVIQ